MNILILDTETTSLDTTDGDIIEIAAVLYNIEHKTILSQFSTLIADAIHNKAEKINKISIEAAYKTPKELKQMAVNYLNIGNYEYIFAHNAEFDKKFVEEKLSFKSKVPWICTLHDFSFGIEGGKKDLVNIALSLDVPVVSAHRALTDCLLIANSFTKMEFLKQAIHLAVQPKKIYVARISYDDREKAKEAGFVWNGLVKGAWAKKISETDVANYNLDLVEHKQ